MASYKNQPTGIELSISFVVLYVSNILGVYLANMFYPKMVVLGTFGLTTTEALLLSTGALAVVNTLLMPLFHIYENGRKRMLSSTEWMIGYAVLNTVALWLISRVPMVLGLGMSSWLPLVLLAVFLDFIQGLGMMGLEKLRTSMK